MITTIEVILDIEIKVENKNNNNIKIIIIKTGTKIYACLCNNLTLKV